MLPVGDVFFLVIVQAGYVRMSAILGALPAAVSWAAVKVLAGVFMAVVAVAAARPVFLFVQLGILLPCPEDQPCMASGLFL